MCTTLAFSIGLGAAKAVDANYETFDFDSWSEISDLKKTDSIKTVSKIIKNS